MEPATDNNREKPDVKELNNTEIEQTSAEELNAKAKMEDHVEEMIQQSELADANLEQPSIEAQGNVQEKVPNVIAEKIQQKDDDLAQPLIEGKEIDEGKTADDVNENLQHKEETDPSQQTMMEGIGQAKIPHDIDGNIQQNEQRHDNMQQQKTEGQGIDEEKMPNDVDDNIKQNLQTNESPKPVMEEQEIIQPMSDNGDANIQQKEQKDDNLHQPKMELQGIAKENMPNDVEINIQQKVQTNNDLKKPMMDEQNTIQAKMPDDVDENLQQKEGTEPSQQTMMEGIGQEKTVLHKTDNDTDENIKKIDDDQLQLPKLECQDIQEKKLSQNTDKNLDEKSNQKVNSEPPVLGCQDIQPLEMICKETDGINACIASKEKGDELQQKVKCQNINQTNSDGAHNAKEKSSMLGCQHLIEIYPDGTYNAGKMSQMVRQEPQNIIQEEDEETQEQDPLANYGEEQEEFPVANRCDDSEKTAVNDCSESPSDESSPSPTGDADDDEEDMGQSEEESDNDDIFYIPSPTGTICLDGDDSSENEEQEPQVPLNASKNQPIETIVLDDSDDESSMPHGGEVSSGVTQTPSLPWGSMVIEIHGLEKLPYEFSSISKESWLKALKLEISKSIKKELERAIVPLITNKQLENLSDPWVPEWFRKEEEEMRRRKQIMWETFYKDLVEDGTLGQPLHNLLKRSNPPVEDESHSEKKIKLEDPLSLSPKNEEISRMHEAGSSKEAEDKDKGELEECAKHQLFINTKINEEIIDIAVDFPKIIPRDV